MHTTYRSRSNSRSPRRQRKQKKGTLKFSDNSVYEGDIVNNEAHGQGMLTVPNGTIYKGEFKHNFMSGRGTMWYADGGTYKGMMAKDKKFGPGTYWYPDGAAYKGFWLNGKKNQTGELILPNGIAYDVEYKNNILIKKTQKMMTSSYNKDHTVSNLTVSRQNSSNNQQGNSMKYSNYKSTLIDPLPYTSRHPIQKRSNQPQSNVYYKELLRRNSMNSN